MSRLTHGSCRPYPYGTVTRSGAPFQTLPVPYSTTTGLVRVRSPLLAESRLMSFPPANEMFQFAGFASHAYEFSVRYPFGWVAPFGNVRIKACSQLPEPFRSVLRPSSPLSAKASTRCPCLLDLSDRAAPVAAQGQSHPPQLLCHTKKMLDPNPRDAALRPPMVRTDLGHKINPSSLVQEPGPDRRAKHLDPA